MRNPQASEATPDNRGSRHRSGTRPGAPPWTSDSARQHGEHPPTQVTPVKWIGQSLLPDDRVDPARRIDPDQAMADLRYAATDLVELTDAAAQLPEPLIRSGVLFAPARILPSTMERIHDRNHGRYVPILLEEGEALIDAAQKGSSAARQVRATLEISARPTAAVESSSHLLADGLSR